jgi:serine/threonine-protein kinase
MIGKLLDHRYQVTSVLATGGFGRTYIAQDTRRPGNPICVVKHLKPNSSDPKIFDTAKRLFNIEAETLEKLGNHDQIPRLLAYFDEKQEFFLVQEFIDGNTLAEELIPGQRWSEKQTIQMLIEVLEILEFVHQQGVIHRDIKPDNIIRRSADYKLVLVDFGAVKQLRSSLVTVGVHPTATVAIGTPGYMPTEQGQGKPRPNSDIYSLGIIAIQALTGVPINQLEEDADTGEIVWQHLASVSPGLAAVLSKMVRYHFKERYQNATEALAACQELVNFASGQKTPSVSPPPLPTTYRPYKPTTGVVRQQTMAVAPANPVRTPSIRKDSGKADPLPLLIGILLASGAAALATNIYPTFKDLASNLTASNTNLGKSCVAIVEGNSNIRSEPSSINEDNVLKSIGEDSEFAVTGRRTKGGWVELKLSDSSHKSAWANSQVITNNEQWTACLRDKGIPISIVEDSKLITARPMPQVEPKSAELDPPEPEEEIEEKEVEEKTEARKSQPASAPKQKNQVVEQARQKFESGDLHGAIATLKSIPANAALGIKETTEIIYQWQQDWAKAEAIANDINKAIDNGQWDKVLAFKDHPDKLPNIKYWQDKLEPLFKEAAANANKKAISQGEKLLKKTNTSPKASNSGHEDQAATKKEKPHSSKKPEPEL